MEKFKPREVKPDRGRLKLDALIIEEYLLG